ncbi:MAG: type II toxin-antitoxin system PemK/MazF family toxin [Solirubrobacteraceae bacterium]
MAELTRGSICNVALGRTSGREQAGRRYAVVVQSDELSLLNTVVVVPTSTSARPATFRPEIVVAAQRTRALCEQIRTVDAQRIGAVVGMLSAAELRSVEDAMEIVLEL